ncbi:glycine--tRNA ligase [Patescibacteria group bacterium]|nr:glycine--tRNA ligase [Patescibacteria group bacterium]
MSDINMEEIVSWAKRRGFVFPSSEIYGGFASVYDFGPLGVELINNLKKLWWKNVVWERGDVEGLDGAIFTHPKIWEASGHVESFTDPLVDCKSCKKRLRADRLLEDKIGVEKVAGRSLAELGQMIQDEEIACPHCGMLDWTEVRDFNLLVECSIGVTEEDKRNFYLRGETCQTIFVNFENVLQSTRQKLPFGIAQIGKAFRNEITTKNFIWRVREFEQMEMQYFCHSSLADKKYDYWKKESWQWLVDVLGIDRDNLRWRQHERDELAHYARDAWDVEYNAPWGWAEFWGQHNRQDWDLKRHGMYSGKEILYYDQKTDEKYIPFVVETSLGVTRLALVVILDAYTIEEVENEKGKKEERVVLKFDKKVAPIKVAILPLMKKDNLLDVSSEIYDNLKKKFVCQHDVTQSIGKRYRRQDEIGTPYCVTVDFDSLEDGQVTIRERDGMEQKRIKIDDLEGYLRDNLG